MNDQILVTLHLIVLLQRLGVPLRKEGAAYMYVDNGTGFVGYV